MTTSNETTFGYFGQDLQKWNRLADPWDLKRMVSLLQPHADESAMDVGTGKGNAALELWPSVREVIAVDYAEGAEIIFQAVPNGKCRYVRFDLTDGKLPAETSSMGIVVCRAALHHIRDKGTFFTEAFRVLRPMGRLFIMDPVMSPNLRMAWNIISKIAERDYQAYCTCDELENLTVKNGFTRVYEGRFPFIRWLDDWIDSKITERDQNGNEALGAFAKYVRQKIKSIITEDFSQDFRRELNLRQRDGKWVFDYDCRELLLIKP